MILEDGSSPPSSRGCFGRFNCMALLFALAAGLVVPGGAAVMAQTKPVPVIIAEAANKELVDRVQALGTLRANEQVTLTAQVTEIITKLHFDDGQRVNAGDVLVEMTSAEEAAQLREAEATAKEAKEQFDRTAPLAKTGVSSEATFAERRRIYETALAQLEAVNSRIEDRRVLAPFGGVLGLRRVSVGALVQPGTVITTIDDDSIMKLDFTVPATFLETLKVGLPIEATAKAFADKPFEGKITSIDSRVDPITRSVTVRAVLPNEGKLLKAGVLMTVEILKNRRMTTVVPEEAVISRGRENSVFVVDPNAKSPQAHQREVKLGAREEEIVEITSGLKNGEYVVTDGALRLTPGQAVEITAIDKGGEKLIDLLERAPSKPATVN